VENNNKTIPLVDCKNTGFYRLDSRNLSFGVFVKEYNGFVGIRSKFGLRFLDVEYHWDTGEPHGTAMPLELICDCPITDLKTATVEEVDGKKRYVQNQELFDWIEETIKVEK